MLLWHDAAGSDVAAQHRPLVLLAIGPGGGAALACWVEAHGLEGVIGVGLVGVTAPWAERSQGRCPKHYHLCGDEACDPAEHRTPLGPLEPLRAVAERARKGEPCECEHHPDPNHVCASCDGGRIYPLRLVIACAPDDGVCARCGGALWVPTDCWPIGSGAQGCPVCSGTGKALSSADVTRELIGDPMLSVKPDVPCYQCKYGGVTTLQYESRAELDKRGLAAALKAAVG